MPPGAIIGLNKATIRQQEEDHGEAVQPDSLQNSLRASLQSLLLRLERVPPQLELFDLAVQVVELAVQVGLDRLNLEQDSVEIFQLIITNYVFLIQV